jgi:putative redox protein
MTNTVIYKGNLRTESTHLASKNIMITDAPIDNQGNGESFSPTDTVATALATCLLTIMDIKARDLNIDISGANVKKIMAGNPRRISAIKIDIYLNKSFEEKIKTILEKAAFSCPVSYSLSPDLNQDIHFFWPSDKS